MIDVRHLFEPLEDKLLSFLRNLEPADWNRKTSAGNWTVKDVTSHLLDGDLRTLSVQRDRYFGEQAPPSAEYKDLVKWLNSLNRDWIRATRRLSPDVLIMLHELTGPVVTHYYTSLDPYAEAIFPVAWAGESTSFNWMHLAREYTEKWHHQQQIRETRKDAELLEEQFFHPYLETSLTGLPHLFSTVVPEDKMALRIIIESNAPFIRYLCFDSGAWKLKKEFSQEISSEIIIPSEISWKLFSGNIRPESIRDKIHINGNLSLGERVLRLVAVMA